jgi:hypothetical protein
MLTCQNSLADTVPRFAHLWLRHLRLCPNCTFRHRDPGRAVLVDRCQNRCLCSKYQLRQLSVTNMQQEAAKVEVWRSYTCSEMKGESRERQW